MAKLCYVLPSLDLSYGRSTVKSEAENDMKAKFLRTVAVVRVFAAMRNLLGDL
jgi:hypothetical protein